MTADVQRQRRALLAIVAVVALIGLGGVTIALLADDGGDPTAVGAPGVSVDPLSAEGQCGSDRVARYAIAFNRPARLTATAAAAPWVRPGETTRSTSSGESGKLVTIGRPAEPPREVLTLRKGARGWQIEQTTACLDATPAGSPCAPERLTVKGVGYRREPQPAGVPGGVAAYVGQATLQVCVEGKFVSRGSIAPVTVYTANEQAASDGVVLVEDDEPPYWFVPVR
ncbi:MAG: hypothetical protein NTV23_09040 [Propionibacteriales bacterium]|nr:hypothetical protein [Propionibacteriales bacterium]